ncbi:CDP-alcohol phosphatidyltransferase-domain-containing protein [Phyllosticta capitalensis]
MEAMARLLPISRSLPASVTPRCLQASGFSHIDVRVGHHYRTCCRPASELDRSRRSLLGLHTFRDPRSTLALRGRHTNPTFPTLLRTLSWTAARSSSPGKPSEPPGEQPSQKPQPKKPLLEKTKELRQQLKSLTTHEQIWNVPNVLTLSRLVAAPAVGYLILHDQHAWALGLFAYAGITDLVDGWIARRWQLQTVVGSVVDPMADKLLMAVTAACLAAKGALPGPLAILIFGRDASLAIAAIYYRYASLPSPKTFARYWDFSLPSAEVHPTSVSKINTFLQLALIGLTLLFPVIAQYATTSTANDSESKPLAEKGKQSLITGSLVAPSTKDVAVRPLAAGGSAGTAAKPDDSVSANVAAGIADAGKDAVKRVDHEQQQLSKQLDDGKHIASSGDTASASGDAQQSSPQHQHKQRHANTIPTSPSPTQSQNEVDNTNNSGRSTAIATAAALVSQPPPSDLPSLVITSVTALQFLVGATTLWSGFSYAVLKNAVTILGSDDQLKKRQGAIGRRIIGSSFAAVCVGAMAWAVGVDGWFSNGKGEDEE